MSTGLRAPVDLNNGGAMTPTDVVKLVQDKKARFADLRFTDTRGKEQHVTVPARFVTADFFVEGKMFDGSSISGWKGINESDMILLPDASTAVLDPFSADVTVILRCDVIEPATMQGYERDPRSLGRRAEAYLKSTGIADGALFGPENEFFIFDSVRWNNDMQGCGYAIDSISGAWNTNTVYPEGNMGHRPGIKGGYFPVPPVDAYQDIRSAMCKALEDMGLKVEVHHHEVATGGQAEIGVGAGGLVRKADEVQILKYCVHNVAHLHGKTATFKPNPYFVFAAMMMEGLDSIQNKMHPGDPADKDLYDLEPEEARHIPQVCHSLDMALEHLDKDREFLKRGGVFTDDVIDAYMGLKIQEITRYRMSTHPCELDMYYSV